MPQPTLITIARAKEWLNTSGGNNTFPPTSDPLFNRLVASATSFALQYLQRPMFPATFTEVYNGNGGISLPLRQRPVIQVRSLTIGVVPITARAAVGSYGFVADEAQVYIDGGCYAYQVPAFYRGIQNVSVVYDAGYQQVDTRTVPAIPAGSIATNPSINTVTDLSRPWNSDRGVVNATSGAPFTLVTVAPTIAGTYQLVVDDQGNSSYLFSAADVSTSVTITYGYTPEDVAQALTELVGERFKTRDRIGETSKGLAQQPTSFSQKDMNATIKSLLNPYRQLVPIT